MKLNEKLEELYRSKFGGLQAITAELESAGIENYSCPLLLNVSEEYLTAPIKIMIFGQETNGWGDSFEEEGDVTTLMNTYKDYVANHNNTTFWNWVEKINHDYFGNSYGNGFVWNNILKFGKNNSIGHPDRIVTELENKYFNVAQEEIAILKPDVCIFLCGPNYDERIREKFPDVEFNIVADYPIREVAQLKSSHLPAHSYRTYHPGYGQRYKNWYEGIFETIVNLVK
ncbi:MAG: hypothetical protein ACI30H_01285 [Paludibacteraceae bacterium]